MIVRLRVSIVDCDGCALSVYHVQACNDDDDVIAEACAHSISELAERIAEATTAAAAVIPCPYACHTFANRDSKCLACAAAAAIGHGVVLVLHNIPADIRTALVDSILARETHEVEA